MYFHVLRIDSIDSLRGVSERAFFPRNFFGKNDKSIETVIFTAAEISEEMSEEISHETKLRMRSTPVLHHFRLVYF
jgi:hypothetical protein